jgi:polyhydroxybutyrate depolymerase
MPVNRLLFCCLVILTTASSVAAESMALSVNGQARTFVLHRPAGQGPHPTIIMLHSGGGGAEQEIQNSGLAQLGPQEGFLAVFPEAARGIWNFFPPGKETVQYSEYFQRHGGLPNDVAFLRALVAELVRDGLSDPRRIYLAGRSLGGAMVLRLACVDAGNFAAIGLLISAMPEVVGSDCHPHKPLPVLMINGTDDRVLPFRGERTVRGDILWPTERLVAFFNDLNGCAEPAQLSAQASTQNVVIERSTTCAGGAVTFYRLVGGGHNIPAALKASQTLLDFFRDKTR